MYINSTAKDLSDAIVYFEHLQDSAWLDQDKSAYDTLTEVIKTLDNIVLASIEQEPGVN